MFDFDEMLGAVEKDLQEKRNNGVDHKVKMMFQSNGDSHTIKCYLLPPLHSDDENLKTPWLSQTEYFIKPLEKSEYGDVSPFLKFSNEDSDNPCRQMGFDIYKNFPDKKDPIRKANKMHMGNEKKYCQLLIVDDNKRPENNGKIVSFELKQKVLERIKSKLNPREDDPNTIAGNPFNWNLDNNLLYVTVSVKDSSTKSNNFNGMDFEYDKSQFVNGSKSLLSELESGKFAEYGLNTIDDLKENSVRLSDYLIEAWDGDKIIKEVTLFEGKNSKYKFWQNKYQGIVMSLSPELEAITESIDSMEVNSSQSESKTDESDASVPKSETKPVEAKTEPPTATESNNDVGDLDLDSLLAGVDDL